MSAPRSGMDIWRAACRRALYAHALRVDGMTYKAIGQEMGVGVARARELAMKGSRIVDRDFRHVAEALEALQVELKARGGTGRAER